MGTWEKRKLCEPDLEAREPVLEEYVAEVAAASQSDPDASSAGEDLDLPPSCAPSASEGEPVAASPAESRPAGVTVCPAPRMAGSPDVSAAVTVLPAGVAAVGPAATPPIPPAPPGEGRALSDAEH